MPDATWTMDSNYPRLPANHVMPEKLHPDHKIAPVYFDYGQRPVYCADPIFHEADPSPYGTASAWYECPVCGFELEYGVTNGDEGPDNWYSCPDCEYRHED